MKKLIVDEILRRNPQLDMNRVASMEAFCHEANGAGIDIAPVCRVAAPLGEAFHSRRLTLRSSQVGAVAAAQRARWSHRRRLSLALALLADPIFDVLLSGESPFAALPATMTRLASRPDGELCHAITYS